MFEPTSLIACVPAPGALAEVCPAGTVPGVIQAYVSLGSNPITTGDFVRMFELSFVSVVFAYLIAKSASIVVNMLR